MNDVMMALGPYRFSIASAAYQSLQRRAAYNWSSIERIGASPARQYVGPAGETISLEGVIYPSFSGGLGQVDKMRLTAGLGLPLPLIEGRGRVLGFWSIIGVDEGQTIFERGGAAQRIEFGLELERYDGGLTSILRF